MRVLCSISLFYACCVIVIRAFPDHPFSPPTTTKRLLTAADSKDVGKPLFLTPLIDAGREREAAQRSQVRPFLGYVENYAGFLTVNRTTKSHLFFWYVPRIYATAEAENAPLILWLQGGMGWSGLYGMFNENGPLKATKKGLQQRPHAWTNKYHMLYIDQPVGAGFSFTEDERGYANTEQKLAEHVYEALVQFYKLFPRFRGRALYIAGESYAAKYVAAIGYKIHTARGQGRGGVPLSGLIIGNGYPDPENMLDYATFLHGIGLADEGQRAKMVRWQEMTKYALQSGNFSVAYDFYYRLMDEISDAINTTSVFDYTREEYNPIDDTYAQFLTQDEVRKRIHVGPVGYDMNSKKVVEQLKDDILQTVRPWIEELLEHYPMLFYSGQLNVAVPHSMTENFLRNVRWSGAMKYNLATSRAWRVDNKLAGFYKSAGNLTHVLVRNAGHMVLVDQPKNALAMIESFIEKKL